MRIGFAAIYAWRPHVEHLDWLAGLARQAGHEVRFLACDADLPSCYGKELRPDRSGLRHCAACRAGGIRSFESKGVSSIGSLARRGEAASLAPDALADSSAATIGRFETNAEFAGPVCTAIAHRLEPGALRAHLAARRWIERERLDAVCVFNARMDATAAIAEAARSSDIHFASLERTWFGDGLQLLPDENCLGLRSVDRLMTQWRNVPLDRRQALRAAAPIAARFLRRNTKEWRAYNTRASHAAWPVANGRRRLLLLPGSRNEVWGHPDWSMRWSDVPEGIDALIDHLGLQPADLLLRCHPNWAERIGMRDGSLSEARFTGWAERRGIHVIGSADSTSTLGLIQQADAVVVCGGSGALEAGILGKQVIALGPSIYQEAGFQNSAYDMAQLAGVALAADSGSPRERARRVARQTLRFCHTMAYRIPQYVDHVRAITTTQYEYIDGADPERLIRLLRSGGLEPDDASAAADDEGESEVLDMIESGAWEALARLTPPPVDGSSRPMRRRFWFRPIDRLRAGLPRGDL